MSYHRSAKKRPKRHGGRRFVRVTILFLAVFFVAGLVAVWWLPIPAVTASAQELSIDTKGVNLPWPHYGESALGASGYGLLSSNGNQIVRPTASVAKLITALVILQKYPLSIGQQGPIITIGPSDLQNFDHYYLQGGSIVKVSLGEQISEYQALQAMLLPSANNMADSLARWAFGSMPSYIDAANNFAKRSSFSNTTIGGDASGFLPDTKSTASDLVKIGLLGMQNPVIAQIVNLKTANIPVAGDIINVNWLLGQHGIIGMKTGNTNEAGGVYVFAAQRIIANNSPLTIVGAIMGAPNLQTALTDSLPLLEASVNNFHQSTVIRNGQIIGVYHVPWAQDIKIAATKDISVLVWGGTTVHPYASFDAQFAPRPIGHIVGNVTVSSNGVTQTSPLALQSEIIKAPLRWRVFRGHFTTIQSKLFGK